MELDGRGGSSPSFGISQGCFQLSLIPPRLGLLFPVRWVQLSPGAPEFTRSGFGWEQNQGCRIRGT